jgi:hypothetical protein
MAIAASLSQENATLWIIANQLFGEMAERPGHIRFTFDCVAKLFS